MTSKTVVDEFLSAIEHAAIQAATCGAPTRHWTRPCPTGGCTGPGRTRSAPSTRAGSPTRPSSAAGVGTEPWWDRQLALCLLGALVQFGWEKALGGYDEELAWWEGKAVAAAHLLG